MVVAHANGHYLRVDLGIRDHGSDLYVGMGVVEMFRLYNR